MTRNVILKMAINPRTTNYQRKSIPKIDKKKQDDPQKKKTFKDFINIFEWNARVPFIHLHLNTLTNHTHSNVCSNESERFLLMQMCDRLF
jgi:hypothetical protein